MLASNSNGSETRDRATIARRCMEQFLYDMKLCSKRGGCDYDERISVAAKHLASIDKLPHCPLLSKVKELISDSVHQKCRPLYLYIQDQTGAKSFEVGAEWICAVCGRQNNESSKKYEKCFTCGREKGCVGSKKLQRLNECRVDPTPHLTRATKDELAKIESCEHRRERWTGDEGKRRVFVSNKIDYEALERASIKSEINDVLASIRQSLA
ncbi:hypothetical protein HJC23_003215 [Cyclotella cryptica]|uniref:RanBP2-type domain-containing protein n=1 Tax=Cyclotella cryptica TaxID=29204 RepID=A0ABD3PDH1_9STRA|eukprot:CCRYP_015471-RA/>CCRYP_015471-RA protein AED:0.28 eAED:0.28 QI:0/-1/0/1/-1/1/1/0/210